MIEECCGTCEFHRKDREEDWYCNNQDSEMYTCYTDYSYRCEDYEVRE